nr:PREDICTED: uncharacterized protein LOC105670930 [Linepithema humile]
MRGGSSRSDLIVSKTVGRSRVFRRHLVQKVRRLYRPVRLVHRGDAKKPFQKGYERCERRTGPPRMTLANRGQAENKRDESPRLASPHLASSRLTHGLTRLDATTTNCNTVSKIQLNLDQRPRQSKDSEEVEEDKPIGAKRLHRLKFVGERRVATPYASPTKWQFSLLVIVE